jgi:hypothetical protein
MAFALLLPLGACGGRSVSHGPLEGTAGGQTDVTVAPPSSDPERACTTLCEGCDFSTPHGESCADFCAEVVAEADVAHCSELTNKLFSCRSAEADGCAPSSCGTYGNPLTACILDYCYFHDSGYALCGDW